MMLVAILIVVGIVLLAIEVVLPGGVLGVLGGLAMLGGVIAAFAQYGGDGGTVTLLVALAALAVTIYIEFKILPRSRVAKAFSMTDTVGGDAPATLASPQTVVGRECVAVTRLAPSGYVTVDRQRFEAFCRSGAAAEGERLRVVGVDNFRLVVTQFEPTS